MKSPNLSKLFTSEAGMILAGGLVVWLLWDKITGSVAAAGSAAVNTVGGVVSGNNAITQGTDYEGAGVAGTLGAATDAASGGLFSDFGTWLGGSIYDWTHPAETRKQSVTPNYLAPNILNP